jgi:hypothetical protein
LDKTRYGLGLSCDGLLAMMAAPLAMGMATHLRLIGRNQRYFFIAVLALALACAQARLYYVDSELPRLEGMPNLMVGPGPWPAVLTVSSDPSSVPDDLVLPTLKALMKLPGATDSCDAYGQPRPDATEYCVAFYRTPQDWRATWPVRKLVGGNSSCKPPFGGVKDADFGQDLPVFGYAHNHTCGLFASSPDLKWFPATKSPEGIWVVVGYGTTPSGKLALDGQGQLIPAWAWLATGHLDAPRFYKWNPAGEVFRWNDNKEHWEFQAVCKPQLSSILVERVLPPKCSPELTGWY